MKKQDIDRPWVDYPVGTLAHSITGGHCIRRTDGWKWWDGATFPTPGADACQVTLPTERDTRLVLANEFIEAIGRSGRRFFFHKTEFDRRFAFIEMDERGRLWWNDEYSKKRIYMHTSDSARWRGFSHGGTLKSLAKVLRDFVMRGECLSADYFIDDGFEKAGVFKHPWGYGADLAKVRAAGLLLGVLV